MEITIFAKKKETKDGKKFYVYLTTLTKKDGSKHTATVRFTEEAGSPDPKKCPQNIVFEKRDGNMVDGQYTREDTGEIVDTHTLWLKSWRPGSEFVDTSLDDYM